MGNKLKDLLEKFQMNDDLREQLKSNEAPVEVKQIAVAILSGCFKVTQGDKCVKIQPTCVEFYCHEEQKDGVKDYIVYHKNNTSGKKDIFPLGILHNHVSGIDITFEKGEDKNSAQRLSFLIREYKVINPDKSEKIDKYPTHLYDALFSQFSIFDGGFKVEWVDENRNLKIDDLDSLVRVNVAEYIKKENGMEKNKIDPPLKKDDKRKESLKYTKDEKYIQDQKKWQFKLKEGHDL